MAASIQERVERTSAGRAAISVFVVVTFAAVLISLLPGNAAIQQKLIGTTQPYINALGLDQNWGVFAPNPRQQVLELQAHVRYADGRVSTWHLPDGGPFIGATWDYRWRKLVEYVTAEDYQQYWRPVASFIAREERARGLRPAHVTLVRRTRQIRPPGQVPPFGAWQESSYYEYAVPGGGA
jgi:hypothetical protein